MPNYQKPFFLLKSKDVGDLYAVGWYEDPGAFLPPVKGLFLGWKQGFKNHLKTFYFSSGNQAVVINNIVFYPFRGNITIYQTPQYKRYQSCITSAARALGGSRFSIASRCRQQALKPGGIDGVGSMPGSVTSRAACNLPTAISWLHKIR